MALAETVHVPLDAMKPCVARFHGLHHRTELVLERDGVRWIDDSKGTMWCHGGGPERMDAR